MNWVRPMKPAPGAKKFSWKSVWIQWLIAAGMSCALMILFSDAGWWHFTILPAIQLILIAVAERAYPTKVQK